MAYIIVDLWFPRGIVSVLYAHKLLFSINTIFIHPNFLMGDQTTTSRRVLTFDHLTLKVGLCSSSAKSKVFHPSNLYVGRHNKLIHHTWAYTYTYMQWCHNSDNRVWQLHVVDNYCCGHAHS